MDTTTQTQDFHHFSFLPVRELRLDQKHELINKYLIRYNEGENKKNHQLPIIYIIF